MKKIHALALFMLAAAFALPAYALPRVTQDAILRDFLWEEFISLLRRRGPKWAWRFLPEACAALPMWAFWKCCTMPAYP